MNARTTRHPHSTQAAFAASRFVRRMVAIRTAVASRVQTFACAAFTASGVRVPPRFAGTVVGVVALAILWFAPAAHAKYAIAQYGEPKYPKGFTHFDYVNPDAPRGGTLTLANPDRRTSFDKFNPFTLRGTSPPGVSGLMFETLGIGSADEPATVYGLLADDIAVAPDGASVTFHINRAAHFNNGDPVTAQDVKYSFDTLMSPQAAPGYKVMLADVKGVTVIDNRRVRFDFRRVSPDLPLLAASVPVFSPKWGVGTDGKRKAFDAITFETPIASGPYLIESYEGGRRIAFRRDPNYWGNDLPVRRGTYNFERIVYKMYADDIVRLEGFKAGEFDATTEYRARSWVRSYVGKRFRDGELVKREFAHHNAAGMQGFILNTRRDKFRDVRVRRALDLALDFQWLNRQLFYNQYQRIYSYFTNSDLAARGMPGEAERKLLEPLRKSLDPAVFGPMVVQPTTAPPASLRENLRQARELLAQAGWTYRDGALRNAKGEPFVFEFLDDGGAMGPVASAYARNLAKLGITLNFRTSDFALYQKRLEAFDFDMISLRYPDSQIPGTELLDRFGSRSADVEGSDNVIGLKDPAVDTLLGELVRARTYDDLVAAARALDRVLMHGYYVVPHWFSSTHRMAYKQYLRFPDKLPLYFTAEGWLVSMWWDSRLERGHASASGTPPSTDRPRRVAPPAAASGTAQ
ncbi:peptide ABC transporter substrate-binding protein [Pandoraea morbifera]|uniref:Peptide ABC transporter substrate-binding protein n=1 Tax=Pandoraea morbifera TaxID=2508300 RepID=A0A5E4YNN0_9BURK|nr:extracellular solute-binding protein [Pandoraea morbifera]VVE50401.1 peptide ABC transporter substrate-binding protein [Pandoraea morbifera]